MNSENKQNKNIIERVRGRMGERMLNGKSENANGRCVNENV